MLVIYHKNCSDGFCAAWVFHRQYPEARFHAANYGEAPPEFSPGETVIIVDFSYPRVVLEEMYQRTKHLVVLDHHKSAMENLAGLHYATFNMDKSGGRLAWEYCFGDEPAPALVDYTEDRDLWKWQLPSSKEYSAGLASLPFDFDVWDDLYQAKDNVSLIADGTAILRYQDVVKGTHIRNAVERQINVGSVTHTVLCCNATTLFSEIAGDLAKTRPFGMAWFRRPDGKYQYSLRSDNDGVDVSEVARAFGGGGHKHAAGFELDNLIV